MPANQNKLQHAKLLAPIVLLFSFSILFSCKKIDVKDSASENVSSANTTSNITSECDVTICEDCVFQETIENDTTE